MQGGSDPVLRAITPRSRTKPAASAASSPMCSLTKETEVVGHAAFDPVKHSSADVLLSYVRTADLIADYPVAILRCSTTSGDGRRDRGRPHEQL